MTKTIEMSLGIVIGAHVLPEGFSFEEMREICLTAERLGFDLSSAC